MDWASFFQRVTIISERNLADFEKKRVTNGW